MVRLARFPSSLLLLLLFSCNTTTEPAPPFLNGKDLAAMNVGGLLQLNHRPLTAAIYFLYDGERDTAEIRSFKEGKEDGIWKQFYPGGRLKTLRFFADGKKVGRFQAWWPDGKPQLDYHFLNDEYEGACTEWNDSGRLVKLMHYHQGREEGRQQWWYDNGKIKANYLMVDGRRFGLLGTKNCVNVSDSIFQ